MMPLLKELREILDSYDQRYAVGETFDATPVKAASYVGPDMLHAAFNFDFSFRPYSPVQFLKAILAWDSAAGTNVWPNYVLSNHDNPRSATRYAQGEDDARVKVALAMLLTMRGTPFLYYGEEIGMRDISLRRNEIMDPPGKRYWPIYKGRDGCRAPMQWDASANAGFSTARPWLPAHPDYSRRNVDVQRSDPGSIFNFVRRLIALRKENSVLRNGAFVPLTNQPVGVLAYLRQDENQTIGVLLNFSARSVSVSLPRVPWRLLYSTSGRLSFDGENHIIKLMPFEVSLLTSKSS
jgi:alpha-glucosidase